VIRVLYVSSAGSALGGAEVSLLTLLGRLDRGRVRAGVVVPWWGDLAEAARTLGIDVSVVDLGLPATRRAFSRPGALARTLLGLGPAAGRIARLIRSRGVDLVHVNTSVAVAGALAARLTGRTLVWHVREMLFTGGWRRRALTLAIPLMADAVVCVSEAVRAYLEPLPRRLARRLSVVFDGLDAAEFRRSGEAVALDPAGPLGGLLREGGPLVGVVSRINPWKGLDVFVEAAAVVARAHPAARFVVVGGALDAYADWASHLGALAAARGLGPRLVFAGPQPRAVVSAILRRADVLVMPTLVSEGLGSALLEAMAWEKPVVATTVGGPAEVVRPGTTGALVPPGDARSLAGAIDRLLADPAAARAMGRAGYARLLAEFSVEGYAGRVTALYRQVLDRGAGAGRPRP
jgi:glycosyltransferase involved in cell wall biosynthesis